MEECYLLKVTFLHGSFSRFLNCTNGTKSRKAPNIFTVSLALKFRKVVFGNNYV